MKSLKLILFSLIFTVITFSVSAQETVKTPEERAAVQTTQLTTNLALSAAQQEQIYAINLGIIQKNDAIRQNESMTSELKTESIKQNNEARNQLIKAVLTPEQNDKFDTMEKMQMNNRKSIQKQTIEPRKKN
jgi:hypothetical protein